MEQAKYVLSIFIDYDQIHHVPSVIASLFKWSARPQCVCVSDNNLLSAVLVGKRDITKEIAAEKCELNDGDEDAIMREHLKEMILVLDKILSAADVSCSVEVDRYDGNVPDGKLCYMTNP